MRDLRAISGQSGRVDSRVDSRVNSGSILDHSGTLSGKPHKTVKNCLHLAVGRAYLREMTKYGVLGGSWVVPG